MHVRHGALVLLVAVFLITVPPPLIFGGTGSGLLSRVNFWAYQIQDVEGDGNLQKLAESRYDLLVIDDVRSVRGDEAFDMAGAVAMLHSSLGSYGQSKLVLAYMDIGEAEDYRWYWQTSWTVGNPDWIVASDPDGWAGNYPVLFWRSDWKSILFGSATSYLDIVLADGLDGIYLDWIEAATFDPAVTAAAKEDKDPRAEMVGLVSQLATYARSQKRNSIVVPQNALDLAQPKDSVTAQYLSTIDGIAQESIWFEGTSEQMQGDLPSNYTTEYLQDLAIFQSAGKSILTIDYAQRRDHVAYAYEQAAAYGFLEYVTLSQLDHLTTTPPPGYTIPEFAQPTFLIGCVMTLAIVLFRNRNRRQ